MKKDKYLVLILFNKLQILILIKKKNFFPLEII